MQPGHIQTTTLNRVRVRTRRPQKVELTGPEPVTPTLPGPGRLRCGTRGVSNFVSASQFRRLLDVPWATKLRQIVCGAGQQARWRKPTPPNARDWSRSATTSTPTSRKPAAKAGSARSTACRSASSAPARNSPPLDHASPRTLSPGKPLRYPSPAKCYSASRTGTFAYLHTPISAIWRGIQASRPTAATRWTVRRRRIPRSPPPPPRR